MQVQHQIHISAYVLGDFFYLGIIFEDTRKAWFHHYANEYNSKAAVKAHRFSKAAEAAITQAGGSVELLPLPWGDRRPPAKGNALTNR